MFLPLIEQAIQEIMNFREHIYERRQALSSRWYIDEIVYGEIGQNKNNNNHAFNGHFKNCNKSYPNMLKEAAEAIYKGYSSILCPLPTDFEDLYGRVQKLLKNNKIPANKVHGVGPLVLYDISLHIGCNIFPHVLPEKYVYVHDNKVKKAAEVLLLKPIKSNVVLTSEFSTWFENFHSLEIEDLLCCFSKDITEKGTFDKIWLQQDRF